MCVCLCARSPYTPPLLAGLCGVGVCAWAPVSAAPRHCWRGVGVCVCVCGRARLVPRHSWLGCAVWMRVPGLGFHLRPATPGWGVGSVFVCGRPLLVPRHSWLGCAVSVRVLELRFHLHPATPGWGVRVCVCLCARSPYTPPLLAGLCGVGVCAWAPVSAAPRHCWRGVGVCVCLRARPARTPPLLAGVCGVDACAWAWVSSAPRHSWLGCWGVFLFVGALCLYPATPGWGVRCGCVCLGSGFGCAPPLLAGVLGCVCVCVRAPLVPSHSWLGCAVWVCVLGLRLRLRPATPGWGVGCVGVCGRDPLVPRHSWPGCAVWVCVLGMGFRLRPATPCWGVGVCVSLCALSACTPPLLAGVCGSGMCAWAWVSSAPRPSWLGFSGVCVFVTAPHLYPATPG